MKFHNALKQLQVNFDLFHATECARVSGSFSQISKYTKVSAIHDWTAECSVVTFCSVKWTTGEKVTRTIFFLSVLSFSIGKLMGNRSSSSLVSAAADPKTRLLRGQRLPPRAPVHSSPLLNPPPHGPSPPCLTPPKGLRPGGTFNYLQPQLSRFHPLLNGQQAFFFFFFFYCAPRHRCLNDNRKQCPHAGRRSVEPGRRGQERETGGYHEISPSLN